jgi:hypothetical protein
MLRKQKESSTCEEQRAKKKNSEGKSGRRCGFDRN